MDDKEILTECKNLVFSPEYKRIRELQLDRIVELSIGNIEPLELKGMLRNIAETDKWALRFDKEKKKNKE